MVYVHMYQPPREYLELLSYNANRVIEHKDEGSQFPDFAALVGRQIATSFGASSFVFTRRTTFDVRVARRSKTSIHTYNVLSRGNF